MEILDRSQDSGTRSLSADNRKSRGFVNDEEELIQLALEGQSTAFETLVIRYQDRLYTAMISIVGNADEAEDVVQESFIQAYLKLDTFQQNSRFFTWVYRIAFNYALARRRRKKGVVSLDESRENSGNEPISRGDSPDDRLTRHEDAQLVHQALALLSEDHRSILVLRELEDLSYEDIAEVLSISIGTVRSRLNRARSALKLQLEKFPDWNPQG
jgi:RNA polymerase sigma-70 factor (ECF subfamily)